MSKYKRLTSELGFGKTISTKEELYDRLYYLENAIEDGTLIEVPCMVGDTVWKAEEDDNGQLIYGTVKSIEYKWIPDAKKKNKIALQTHFIAIFPKISYTSRAGSAVVCNFIFEFADIRVGTLIFLTEAEARKWEGRSPLPNGAKSGALDSDDKDRDPR